MRRGRLFLVLTAIVSFSLPVAACGDQKPGAAPAVKEIAIGATADLAITLEDARRSGRRVALRKLTGRRATVILAWSVPCPCVEAVRARVERLIERYGALQGVAWVAIDGEPGDTREQVNEKLLRMDVSYPLLLDPTQAASQALGLTTATQVAILDRKGRLAYRGALDDDLAVGKGEHVAAVLEALIADRPPPYESRPLTYGCAFGDPAAAARLR